MNKKMRFIPSIVSAALSLVLISACGQSDLEAIEKRELDTAQRLYDAGLQQELESSNEEPGAQNPDTTPDETSPDTSEATSSNVEKTNLELMFSDEFNGDSIDDSKWLTVQQWGADLVINDELQYYVDTQSNPDFGYNPFSFDGESLIITAIETPANLQTVANNQPYLSGVLTTAGKFEMNQGYVEARMAFPKGTGLWPAFWMLSADFEDLKPQLFIAEGNGAQTDSVYHNYNYHDENGNLRSPGQWQVTDSTLEEGFHTFGVSWKAEELLFYVDGTPRYRIIGENVAKQAMYLIANLAVGGNWPGSPDSLTTFPAQLKIDYIRAYRHVAAE